ARLNGGREQPPHRRDEVAALAGSNSPPRGQRVDAAGVQHIIDIDIAETCNELLIEQGGLDRPLGVLKPVMELLWGDFQGIRPKIEPTGVIKRLNIRKGPEAAESPGIHDNDLRAAFEVP